MYVSFFMIVKIVREKQLNKNSKAKKMLTDNVIILSNSITGGM